MRFKQIYHFNERSIYISHHVYLIVLRAKPETIMCLTMMSCGYRQFGISKPNQSDYLIVQTNGNNHNPTPVCVALSILPSFCNYLLSRLWVLPKHFYFIWRLWPISIKHVILSIPLHFIMVYHHHLISHKIIC